MAVSRACVKKAGKIIGWFAVVLAVLLATLTVFVLTFNWNHARPWINDKVSQAIGRPFAIEGDLKIGWHHPAGESGWQAWVPWPRFSAETITVANPDWARDKHFATLEQIYFDVKVLPLLARDIVIPAINLVNPSVDLERLADGRNNWTFKLASSSEPSSWTLQLHDIAFAKGHVKYSDQKSKTDVEVVVDTLGQPVPLGEVMKAQETASRKESAQVVGKQAAKRLAAQVETASVAAASAASTASAPADASAALAVSTASVSGTHAVTKPGRPEKTVPTYAIGWTVKGSYNHQAVSGKGAVGGVLALQDAKRPFPLQADVKAGDLHVALVGTLTDPVNLGAIDLRLWLQGVSMAHLYALTGVTLPDTPPYATDGRLIGQFKRGGSVFRYENFTGRVGGSDLNGTLTYTARKPRPSLQGELVSNVLQFSDLAPLIGADSNASKAKRGDTTRQPTGRVLPVEAFRTERWKAIDADVKFTGRRLIKDPSLPITNLYTHVVMNNGVLSFEPLSFGVAGGTLTSTIHLDGSATPLKGRFSTSARHLKLKQLLPDVKTMQTALGEINGDAALSATGNSPAALAATANGEIKAVVIDGTVSRLIMEAAGLNVANVVYEKLFGARDVKINCAAADFVATNGVLDSRVFALDTADAVINIDGHVNLRDESMDLGIHPHTKGFRVFSLRSPLYVKGTFKDPHVGVDAGALMLRGGAMIGLGLINPFAALIPLIAPSNNQPLPCAALMSEMRTKPGAPPPGQKQKSRAPLPLKPVPDAAASKPAARNIQPPANAVDYRGS
ncbi:AsmA family protein [Paraburkholderia bonniea]|uniref:AsmA family protein n=1 Tax=Paraburkholderia bonniea TaxID=2152891 RepID=UPI00257426FD|nr:AsmA family protein [Paraburkholderia bonniea]WJF89014.1 AsmA family protein [Paraburkholderia bonniea]WJF92330.1 AsmA family protein [Paraburkholderia bonniea]